MVGMSLSDIQKKREQREEITKKSKEAALAYDFECLVSC